MIQEIETVSPADRQKQTELLDRVDALLDDSRATQDHLARNFIQIGIALLEVDKSRAWVLRAKSSDQYIKNCEGRFGKGRTALYNFKSVAENLLPHVSEQKLLEMGISKAQPLAQYTRRSGGKLPESLINEALDPKVSVDEFRASIAEAQHEKPEKGKWYDLGGFYCTADEKIEIDMGLERAETIEPLPENIPVWMARKIAIQRLVAEFLATYPSTENG